VDELPGARRNKLHHTARVAWVLLMEEERRQFGLLPSAAKNRGVLTQRSSGKASEGGMSVGVDGRGKATMVRTAWRAYPLVTTEVVAQTVEVPRAGGGGAMSARWFYLPNGGRRVVARWATPPDRRARRRSQPMIGGPAPKPFPIEFKRQKLNFPRQK
jgi:hypothetical protein